MMDRLCVYLIYDKDGILDDYKVYMMKCLKRCGSKLLLIVNGRIHELGKIEGIADYVVRS